MERQSAGGLWSRYLPLIAWLVFIFVASSDGFSAANTSRLIGPFILWLFPNTSAESLALIHLITRKSAHFAEYAVLGFVAARAFRTSPRPAFQRRWFQVSLILIVVYALIDEYHQSFIPTRSASVLDSLIDMTGGLAALIVIRRRQRP